VPRGCFLAREVSVSTAYRFHTERWHAQMSILPRKRTMMTKNFIIPARHRRVQRAHPLCDRSRRIILAVCLHPERPRILHPIYRKLPNLEFLLTRPRKRWLRQNIPLHHMRCMCVGRGITMFRIVAIVNVVLVSCSAGYVWDLFLLLSPHD
jgi:hypothetical protein